MWQPNTLKNIKLSSLIIEEIKRLYSYSHANGGVILECFEVINKEVFRAMPFMKNEYNTYFENLLSCHDIVSALSEFKITTPGGSIDTLFYILWSGGDSPCLIAKLDRIIHCIGDVTCVGGDQFIFCPEIGVVIEFYHEGEITIGFN